MRVVTQLRCYGAGHQAGLRRFAHRGQMVFGHHVVDLVRQDASQLGLIGHRIHQALGHKHVSTGRCKGVVARVVQDGKSPGQIGAIGLQADPAAQAIHIALQGHIPVQGFGAQEHRGKLAAHFDFLGLVDLFHRLRQ